MRSLWTGAGSLISFRDLKTWLSNDLRLCGKAKFVFENFLPLHECSSLVLLQLPAMHQYPVRACVPNHIQQNYRSHCETAVPLSLRFSSALLVQLSSFTVLTCRQPYHLHLSAVTSLLVHPLLPESFPQPLWQSMRRIGNSWWFAWSLYCDSSLSLLGGTCCGSNPPRDRRRSK
jgi:hypothetical protein